MAFGFLKKIVKTTRKGIGGAIRISANVTGEIGKQIGKTPVIGSGLKGVYNLSFAAPFQLANDIASGKRIDRVALRQLKRHVSDVKDVAPYAQMVISFVPGVGTGISGAMAAGLALAEGQPITQALINGIKGSLPGGALSSAAFDVGCSAVQGKPLTKTLVAALPLDDKQKDIMLKALSAAQQMANGKRVDEAIFDNAQKLLPATAQRGIEIGMAMAQGHKLQKIAAKNVKPQAVLELSVKGKAIAKANPVLTAGAQLLKPNERNGFAVATGMLMHKIAPITVVNVRGALNAEDRKGFDAAMATATGMTRKAPAAVKKLPAREQLGYYMTQGIAGASSKLKGELMKTIATDASARSGAVIAIEERGGWWKKLLIYLGIEPKKTGINLTVRTA